MNGIWILLLLVLTASLPAILIYFWFRAKKSSVTLPWFLASLAAGIIAFLLAALFHYLFIPNKEGVQWHLFYTIFIRIALVEEASRLITLIPFFLVASKGSEQKDSSFGAALGLAAGLGFAIIESTYHGISDLSITILRLFTAAPLHGTCGIRAGTAIFSFRRYPARSIFLFASTVLIHGTYNLIIVSPAYPSAIAIIITFAALFASLNQLKAADTESDD